MRVGLYLELLTCLGIAEAVGDGDLLRQRISSSPRSDGSALNVEGWKRVWALRQIAFGRAAHGAGRRL